MYEKKESFYTLGATITKIGMDTIESSFVMYQNAERKSEIDRHIQKRGKNLQINNNFAPIFGISRLRIGIDGIGITTLVAFMGCPLHCKYCLNDFCHKPVINVQNENTKRPIKILSPQQLYDAIQIDKLYFQVSGGGICFGGGEPGLRYEFIKEFKKIYGDSWKITIETCLHYSEDIIKQLAEVVDYWIVDIKSLDPSVFENYTGLAPAPLLNRLKTLYELVGQEKVTIKIPLIPDFNNEEQVAQSKKQIKDIGFQNIKQVKYFKTVKECDL